MEAISVMRAADQALLRQADPRQEERQSMTQDLFGDAACAPWQEMLCPGAMILRRFALADAAALLAAVDAVAAQASFRHMTTRGGLRMSAAMTNCGAVGWVSDAAGYRYDALDPVDNAAWPPMPATLAGLAERAAAAAGFPGFRPDACLINRYAPGARLALHQDKDERDFTQPIVSVSLGLPAVFLFGGLQRTDRAARVLLEHGDVVVWGGPARLRYHGVLPVKEGFHPATGGWRVNLTFRVAG